jgi:hypothetical protein
MNKETFGIGILSLTALVLFIAVYFSSPVTVLAGDAVQSHDFQMVTARISTGSEGLYILDNRTGVITVFTYDVNAKRMVPRASRPMAEMFPVAR